MADSEVSFCHVETIIYKIYVFHVSDISLCVFQLTKALRDLPVRIQTASKKERNAVLQNVVTVLSNPGSLIVVFIVIKLLQH
jgi:hypothetical protein